MESGALLARPEPRASSDPDRRGGWRAALFLIAVAILERVGFVGVQGNLIMYLTGSLGMSTAAAAASANAWGGTVLVLTLVGALAADSRLGRYRAVLVAGVLYLLSLGMLTVSSMMQAPKTHPTSCHGSATACSPSSTPPARLAFFYVALYLLGLAQGFHKPCSEAFGADQFPQSDPGMRASRSSYFNWFHFSISWGYATATTVLSYVEDNVGWTVGFAACWATMVVHLAVFLLGTGTYRTEQPVVSAPFDVSPRSWAARAFSRKDTANTERLLKEEDADSKGFLVKLLPIWVTSIVFAAIIAQVDTLFTKQGNTMDRCLGAGLVVPPTALQGFVSITFIVSLPMYDRALVPLARRLTRHPAGITMLQRVGGGMTVSCLAMAVAALVEAKRLRTASDAGLVDRPDVMVPMSVWWLVPQYVLAAIAKMLGAIGLEEFFYDQMPDELRSVGIAMCLSVLGVGSYASSMLVSSIDWVTRRKGESWFSDNLNRAHLDYFYWLLAALAALEVAMFLYFARRYVYKNKAEL